MLQQLLEEKLIFLKKDLQTIVMMNKYKINNKFNNKKNLILAQ